MLGTLTDDSGRRGTAVALTLEGVRHELIFDPGSSLLLGQRDIIVTANPLLSPQYLIGTTIRSSLYRTRVVDSITATG